MDSRRKNGCLGLLSALLKLLVLLRPCEADHSSSLSVVVKKQPHLYAPHSTHGLLTQHTLTFKSRCGSTTKTQLSARPELCVRYFRPLVCDFIWFFWLIFFFFFVSCSVCHFILTFNTVFIMIHSQLYLPLDMAKALADKCLLCVGKWWNGTLAWLRREAVWPLSPLKQMSIVLFSSNHNKWFIPQQTCIAVKQSYNWALIPYLRSWHDAKTRRQAFCKGSDSAKWHGPEQQILSFPQCGVT